MSVLAWELICYHKIRSDDGMVYYVTMQICCGNVCVYVIYSVG